MIWILLITACTMAALCLLNRIRIRDAKRLKDRRIPVVNDDCIRAYEEAIKVIFQRIETVKGMDSTVAIHDRLGFCLGDDLWNFYPAIAMIRLCHLSGYEVEFRPMRTERSPLKEGEIVSRMKKSETENLFYET